MLDDVVRIGILVVGGLALVLVVIWYLRLSYQEIRGTGEVVIDPFTVVDDAGKSNEEVGKALAQMLQSRIESLTTELRDAQAGLTTSATSTAQPSSMTRVGDVRLWTQDAALHTGLLQPVNMKISVGGVDVGGVVPWFQRQLSNRRTLHFTLYSHADEAQVYGSLGALRMAGAGVRVLLKGVDGKAPSLDVIVDSLAHEIIRRWLAQDGSNKLDLLHPSEFVTLADVVVSAAESNRRLILGRPAQSEFADLLPRITALSDKVPDWPELGYFAAWIADKARNSETAIAYYRRVVPKLDTTQQETLIALINSRISSLGPAPPLTTQVSTGEAIKPTLDYSSAIKRVRDSGQEGSVVGLALATALEFQIEKATHEDHPVSARYIYYAVRLASGTTEIDSGAVIKDAINVLATQGAVEEKVWPYVPGEYAAKPPPAVEKAIRFRITHARSLNGLEDVKRALSQNGPVVAGITMFESALSSETSKTGVIPMPAPKAQVIGGHAIVVVGYDDEKKRVKFVNSWGPSWGQKGFGYLPYEYIKKYMSDAWTFRLART